MKNIQEIMVYAFGENPRKVFVMAAQWLQEQLKHVPEGEQLAWAKVIRYRDDLAAKYGMELTRYYNDNGLEEHFDYEYFTDYVALLCIEFYDLNGGEMDADTKYFMEKNSMELGYGNTGTPNVISERKDRSGKFIVSSIL